MEEMLKMQEGDIWQQMLRMQGDKPLSEGTQKLEMTKDAELFKTHAKTMKTQGGSPEI